MIPHLPSAPRLTLLALLAAGFVRMVLLADAASGIPVRAKPPALPVLRIELLEAPVWQLTLLPGIGRGRAYGIVARRAALRRWADLRAVPGIGPRTLARLMGPLPGLRLTLAGRAPPPAPGRNGPPAPPVGAPGRERPSAQDLSTMPP